MTRREIIEDVARAYNLDKRALSSDARVNCTYDCGDGRRCAVGRYVLEERIGEVKAWETTQLTALGRSGGTAATTLFRDLGLEVLKPEVRHVGVDEFWNDLQRFHDNVNNWTETGLTRSGVAEKQRLLDLYGE